MYLELLASCEEQTKSIDLLLQKTQNNHELLLFIEFSRTHFYQLWNDMRFSEFFRQSLLLTIINNVYFITAGCY